MKRILTLSNGLQVYTCNSIYYYIKQELKFYIVETNKEVIDEDLFGACEKAWDEYINNFFDNYNPVPTEKGRNKHTPNYNYFIKVWRDYNGI